MAGEWREATVRDLVDAGVLERPMDGNHGELHPKGSDFVTHGIPFIMASDLLDGRVDTQHCAFITEEQARSLRKGFAYSGDVLISHKATMGRTALVRELDVPFLMLTPQVTYYRIRDTSQLDRRFLQYYFDSPRFQHLFETWGHKGSTRDYLGITSQLDLPVVLPSIDEQRAIAHILGTLDDKIELNRRMNETLEAMARALFKSWFVDFDPVRAKAEGRQPARMDVGTAALFPDSFIESELGLLPKGWDIKPVREIIEDLFDGPHATPAEASEGAVYLGIKNLTGTQIDLTEIRYISELDWPQWTKRMVPRPHDIVFTYEATLGAFAIVPADLRCCLGRRLALVRPKTGQLDYCFLFHTFVSKAFQELLMARANQGSTVNRIPLIDFPKYPVIWPARQLIDRFHRLAEPLWNRIHQNQAEARNLFAIRDLLLPKLISSELRVRDAERFIGRAV